MSISPVVENHTVGRNVDISVDVPADPLVIKAIQTFITVLVTQSIVRVHLEVVVGHPYVHIAHRGTEVTWVAESISSR